MSYHPPTTAPPIIDGHEWVQHETTPDCTLSSYHAASPECSTEVDSTPLTPTATTQPPEPSIDVDGQLPVTGGEVITLVFVATLLLFAGSVSLAAARLARRTPAEREDTPR